MILLSTAKNISGAMFWDAVFQLWERQPWVIEAISRMTEERWQGAIFSSKIIKTSKLKKATSGNNAWWLFAADVLEAVQKAGGNPATVGRLFTAIGSGKRVKISCFQYRCAP